MMEGVADTNDPQGETLDWGSLFEGLDVQNVYPVHTFSKFISEIEDDTDRHIATLDFSGIEQLTDYALCVLASAKGRLHETVHNISLMGCAHITNYGIQKLSEKFTKLKEINLEGCVKLTTLSICHLQKNCPDLVRVSCTRDQHLDTTLLSKVNNDNEKETRKSEKEAILKYCRNTWKLVILGEERAHFNITHFLESQKFTKIEESNILLHTKNFKVAATEEGEELALNIFECQMIKSFYPSVISENAVYVIVQDMMSNALNYQLHILSKLESVWAIDPGAPFILLLLYSNDNAKEHEEITRKVMTELLDLFKEQQKENNRIKEKYEEGSADMNFAEQIQFGRLLQTMEADNKYIVANVNIDTLEVQEHHLSENPTSQITKEDIAKLMEDWNANYWAPAIDGIQGLSKSDITELKSFSSPPSLVLQAMSCVTILFNLKPEWREIKKMLSNYLFINSMVNYEYMESLTEKIVRKLKPYMNDEQLTVKNLRMKSQVASVCFQWASAIYQWGIDVMPIYKQFKASSDGDEKKINSYPVKTGEEGYQSILNMIRSCTKTISTMNPTSVMQPISLQTFTPVWEKLTSLEDLPSIVDQHLLIEEHLKMADSHMEVDEHLKLLHKKGQLVYFPEAPYRQPVITDIQWFMDCAQRCNDSSEVEVQEMDMLCHCVKYTLDKRSITDRKDINGLWNNLKEIPEIPDETVVSDKVTGNRKPPFKPDVELVEKYEEDVVALFKDRDKFMPGVNVASEERVIIRLTSMLGLTPTEPVREWIKYEVLPSQHKQGTLLYFSKIEKPAVIFNVSWFLGYLTNADIGETKYANNKRVPALAPNVAVLNKPLLNEILQFKSRKGKAYVFHLVTQTFCHLGILVRIPPHGMRTKPEYFPYSHTHPKAFFRSIELESRFSQLVLKTHVWDDGPGEDEVQVSYRYRYTHGLPAALVQTLFQDFWKISDHVVLCWRYGILFRIGVVEVMVTHHIHASTTSSYLDVIARATKLYTMEKVSGPDSNPDEGLRTYFWSVMSQVLRLMDYHNNCYPFLHVKVGVDCQGECGSVGLPHSFYNHEVKRSESLQLACPKCDVKALSKDVLKYVQGRQRILPFHDWVESREKCSYCSRCTSHMTHNIQGINSASIDSVCECGQSGWLCKHCGICRSCCKEVWMQESSLFPSFINDVMVHTTKDRHIMRPLKGNILRAWGQTYISQCDLRFTEMAKFTVTLLQAAGIRIALEATSRQANKSDDGGIKENLNIEIDGSSSKLVEVKPHNELKVRNNITFSQHDVIELVAKDERYEVYGTQEILVTEIEVAVNGKMFHSCVIPANGCSVKVKSTNKSNGEPLAILEAASAPVVTADHFQPGKKLLLKNDIGNQWREATIHAINNGKLELCGQGTSVKVVSASSDNIMPLKSEWSFAMENRGLDIIQSDGDHQDMSSLHMVSEPLALFPRFNDAMSVYEPAERYKATATRCSIPLCSPWACKLSSKFDKIPRTFQHNHLDVLYTETLNVTLLPILSEILYFYNPCRKSLHNTAPKTMGFGFICQDFKDEARILSQEESVFEGAPALPPQHLLDQAMVPVDPEHFTLQQTLASLNSTKHNGSVFTKLYALINTTRALFSNKKMLRDVDHLCQVYPHLRSCKDHVSVSCIEGVREFLRLLHDTYILAVTLSHDNSQVAENLKLPLEQRKSCPVEAHKASIRSYTPGLAGGDLRGLVIASGVEKPPNGFLQGCPLLEYLVDRPLDLTAVHDKPEPNQDLKLEGGNLIWLTLSDSIPANLTSFTQLATLDISGCGLMRLPERLGELHCLKFLNISENFIRALPDSFCELNQLEILIFNGLPQQNKQVEASTLREAWLACCEDPDFNSVNSTQRSHTCTIAGEKITTYPRLFTSQEDPSRGGVPWQIFQLRRLAFVSLRCQGITVVPNQIGELKYLKAVHLSQCYLLESISGEIGHSNFKDINIDDCISLKTPPLEIVTQGNAQVVNYLKRLKLGSVECYRTKLMLVGLGGAGKTSLIRSLMSKDNGHKAPTKLGDNITDGIDISTWQVDAKHDQTLSYSVWDFAGQSLYYNTHQFFLSKRAVYLLIWNTRLGYEHAGLDFWLSSIQSHAPEAPIFIVGTHADKVSKSEIPQIDLKERYPSIEGFFKISSLTGKGVVELLDGINEATLKQPYIGERVPQAWIGLERALIKARSGDSILDWDRVVSMAEYQGINDKEVGQVIRFLNDLGVIQHFEKQRLRDKVVINPQWIVDVMSCIVSVHDNIIQDGKLQHKDVSTIWKKYQPELHDWLLHLTETFDLTFPLPDEEANIVPCLLPSARPKIDMPLLGPEEYERKLVYVFDYLPAGLFNRVQVRLCQYTDNALMWKNGSLLKKNNQMALITKFDQSKLQIEAMGVKPDNMILLIHEVIESLLYESFHGVKYKYMLPCKDCIKEEVNSPMMFTSDILRRVVDRRALFLQCHKHFHSISIQEVQAAILPSDANDFDLQIQNAVQGLDDLKQNFLHDIFFLYCQADIPADKSDESQLHPGKLMKDLEEAGYSCCFKENLTNVDVEDIMTAMQDSRHILVFISTDFVHDPICQSMYLHARNFLHKPTILAMVGTNRDWQNTNIGMMVSHQVYINMQRMSQYPDKLKELKSRLTQKAVKKNKSEKFDVFLSYCWSNSGSAVKAGKARGKPGSVGAGDPRLLKEQLEASGVKCWLDIEQVGENGLFEDIVNGIKNSKVIIACISDEYVSSANCQSEFRFAHITAGAPIVLAIMGTGCNWEATEIGLLSLGYPKYSFQAPNNAAFPHLLETCKETIQELKEKETEMNKNNTSDVKTKLSQNAYQELYELAQRKFLRQITMIDPHQTWHKQYPRLFVIDVYNESKSDTNTIPDEKDIPEMCFKFLCEHEGGWHTSKNCFRINLNKESVVDLLELCAPYLARIHMILKHSDVGLACLDVPAGKLIMETLERHTGSVNQLNNVYKILRQHIMHMDGNIQANAPYGGLARCQMPWSGKILWLCKEHQEETKSSVTSDMDPVAPFDHWREAAIIDQLKKLRAATEKSDTHGETTENMKPKIIRTSPHSESSVDHNASRTLPESPIPDESMKRSDSNVSNDIEFIDSGEGVHINGDRRRDLIGSQNDRYRPKRMAVAGKELSRACSIS
ncbi:unnamed protein product [Owenia fusiformis]|uniref:non-specific serine/threonine protein kinase n=1 Tax=Owenia fusiformis TaxID=6347 RepID=A0A8J1Y0Y1_OWEFU|nr:unnamed protein product [Owenia fusiformis]